VSDHALPENPQFAQLSRLVRRLGGELANYRKRALSAEAKLRTMEQEASRVAGTSPKRVLELERENADLARRLGAARTRTEKMLARVRFLKQQRDGAA
jgi:ribosomal protein S2